MEQGHMLAVLSAARIQLRTPAFFDEPWESLDVDYEPPRVERLYRQLDVLGVAHRLYLHRIHPVPDGRRPLFHPHPWPSAVSVLDGRYVMEVGHGPGEGTPPIAATVLLTAGAAYEMIDRDGWHSVSPLGDTPSLSLMITGTPWNRWSPASTTKLHPLAEEAKRALLATFRASLCEGP